MTKNPQMIFVNLPVADLVKPMAFNEAVGFRNNPQFSDDTGACMVLSETTTVMLLPRQMGTVHKQGYSGPKNDSASLALHLAW